MGQEPREGDEESDGRCFLASQDDFKPGANSLLCFCTQSRRCTH